MQNHNDLLDIDITLSGETHVNSQQSSHVIHKSRGKVNTTSHVKNEHVSLDPPKAVVLENDVAGRDVDVVHGDYEQEKENGL